MNSLSNWIVGAIIGLVISLIIVLILQNTVFKNMNMKILYIIMFVLFGAGGAFVQNSYFTLHESAYNTPQEQLEEITATIGDTWKNTNGGFTFEQIQKSQDDNECPFHDDQIINLKCYDFDSYIVFSYKNVDKYENIVFYKSDDGLILDGVINTYASIPGTKWFLAYDLDTFKWVTELNKEPYYWTYSTTFDGSKINGSHDDLVSISRQSQYFVKWTHAVRTNQDNMVKYVTQNATNLTAKNATSHFIKFGDVELIGTANTGFIKINSFYNYLYNQIKGVSYNTSKIIDGSNSLCLPIPQSQQHNYPISASKKAEYNNADYYGVYRCNIAVNLSYVKGNKEIKSTIKNEKYVETLKNDKDTKKQVEVEEYRPNYTFSKLSINFVDSRSSDVSNVNLLQKPVEITFTCSDSTQTKRVLIDSFEKLNAGVNVLLTKNTTWNYYVGSEALIFENFRGSFTIKSNASNLSFSYYYLNNYTIASVGLNPIGTIDLSVIDLYANPVKVILSNDNHTYQFTFADNSMLNEYQSMLVEMGEYNYTILSKQLIFASVTGRLTITTTDKIMLFNYALGAEEALTFTVDMQSYGTNNNYFYLYSDSSNVTLVRDTLSSAKVYLVNCVIYDQDGRLMESFDHTHSSTGNCSCSWYAYNLTVGERYTLQLRFTDRDDTSVTYLSDISDFTYTGTNGYKIVYTVRKNN